MAYFKNIFREEFNQRPTFNGLEFNKLSETEASFLTAEFSKEEIDSAVASCNSDKTPGPDAFNFKFIHSAWEIIKHDVFYIVQEFWVSFKVPRGCNTAFITLIPKTENPTKFKDFRPISIVGCFSL